MGMIAHLNVSIFKDGMSRRLPRLRPANHPDRLAHQLEQWRKAEQEQQDRVEMRDFTELTGIGIGQ